MYKVFEHYIDERLTLFQALHKIVLIVDNWFEYTSTNKHTFHCIEYNALTE